MIPKNRGEKFPSEFLHSGFFLGGVSHYAATPMIVALSPVHSDITRFRPWSHITSFVSRHHLYFPCFFLCFCVYIPFYYLFLYFIMWVLFIFFDVLLFKLFFRSSMSFYFYFLPSFTFFIFLLSFPCIMSQFTLFMPFSSFHRPSFCIVDSEIPEPIFIWIGRQYNFRARSCVVIVLI